MAKESLISIDLQMFSEDEAVDTGENNLEPAEQGENEETTEEVSEETVAENESGNDEPPKQTDEENARYAAIRRRAEDDARRKYEGEINAMNQQIAALCEGVTHPKTGQPITNIRDYVDALTTQQRMASEQELQEKGIDPAMIDRMIANNPVVMQARQVLEKTQQAEAETALQNDLAEIMKIDPTIKGIQDLANLPNFPDMVSLVGNNKLSLVDAYKMVNFDTFMQHTNQAARQQAINQMRGKDHLASQPTGVATENDDVEVPAEIMSRWKSEGKTEKQIRELYKSVANKLHIN